MSRATTTRRRHGAERAIVARECVWVCVPTYNEAPLVRPLVQAVLATLERAAIQACVLIVDDNSPDGTGDVAEQLRREDPRVHVLHRERKEGLGPAYLAGFERALSGGASLIAQMDCDFSHDPQSLPALIAQARRDDMALGSRYVAGGRVVNFGASRRALSRLGCAYARSVLNVGIRDLTGGFKVFRREVLEALPLDEVSDKGYGFQIEMTQRALDAGFSVGEVPITFRGRAVGESKMTARIAVDAALNVLRIRLRRWRVGARLSRVAAPARRPAPRPRAGRSRFAPRTNVTRRDT
jgi:dolichol-phosphate mannosyltransferase